MYKEINHKMLNHYGMMFLNKKSDPNYNDSTEHYEDAMLMYLGTEYQVNHVNIWIDSLKQEILVKSLKKMMKV